MGLTGDCETVVCNRHISLLPIMYNSRGYLIQPQDLYGYCRPRQSVTKWCTVIWGFVLITVNLPVQVKDIWRIFWGFQLNMLLKIEVIHVLD